MTKEMAQDDNFSMERDRFKETFDLLPEAGTVLEIGFNDMRMSRLLAERYDVYGIDLLRSVNKKIQSEHDLKLSYASIEDLPFPDNSFDMVLCAQVLEHLPESVLKKGVQELARVARQWVFVSVPYCQRVWNENYKCTQCGFIGHSMEHLYYFDKQRLLSLFPGWRTETFDLVGSQPGYAPDRLYSIANKLGNSWSTLYWKCTKCRQEPGIQRENLIGFIVRRIIWRLEKRVPRREAWMLALLEYDSIRASHGAELE
ncbi:MAG: class I SAM-dependent methyltransferase [Gammaproteobacteria bacterium]|nr:class I SAM-dependent methyltransferase [Gammaproteobacteria bacterium]MCF6261476.1 class I SAM-dependent methyltransferase [Gammaproteobacteria bacterium]